MPGEDYGDLRGSLPAIASLNASYSTSMSLPSPYLFVPPAERKTISDVRRTFCLFVTFDLLFISLLWLIELNVSVRFCSAHRRPEVCSKCCRLIGALCSVFLQISSSIKDSLEREVVHYDFKSSFFDIFVSSCIMLVCNH